MNETPTKQAPGTLEPDLIRAELSLPEPESIQVVDSDEPDVALKADQFIAAVMERCEDRQQQEQGKASVEAIGWDLQRRAAACSEKLKDPVNKLAQRSGDGGEVAQALLQLRGQVEALDPPNFDGQAGFLTRILGYIPGIGSPLKRYFSRYESAQTVIDSIICSLELGREQLKRDSIALADDQGQLQEVAGKLVKTIKLAQLIDYKLQTKLDTELESGSDEHIFVSEGLLFPVRQRIMDLQQQLAVAQQGTIAIEIIIRNNQELIRGVNRALQVTVSALQVAVTVALALADQKLVLDKVQALSSTTSTLIAKTAERLKTQGTVIHKAAAGTMLDMNSLRNAFSDIRLALDEISQFRRDALPHMTA